MTTLGITGYSDRISVQPGQTIKFHVHSERSESYRADIVRLIHGDTNPDGPGYKEEEIATTVSGDISGASSSRPCRVVYLCATRCAVRYQQFYPYGTGLSHDANHRRAGHPHEMVRAG